MSTIDSGRYRPQDALTGTYHYGRCQSFSQGPQDLSAVGPRCSAFSSKRDGHAEDVEEDATKQLGSAMVLAFLTVSLTPLRPDGLVQFPRAMTVCPLILSLLPELVQNQRFMSLSVDKPENAFFRMPQAEHSLAFFPSPSI